MGHAKDISPVFSGNNQLFKGSLTPTLILTIQDFLFPKKLHVLSRHTFLQMDIEPLNTLVRCLLFALGTGTNSSLFYGSPISCASFLARDPLLVSFAHSLLSLSTYCLQPTPSTPVTHLRQILKLLCWGFLHNPLTSRPNFLLISIRSDFFILFRSMMKAALYWENNHNC